MDAPRTEEEKPKSWMESTLKLAGWSYLFGDAMMFAAGWARSNPASVWGASSWFAGGIGAAVYGNPDAERQLRIQSAKLQQYLKQKGITIPDNVRAQSELLQSRGFWESVQNYCYEHPSEILNGGYLLGAGILLRDGLVKDFAKGSSKLLLPKVFSVQELQKVSSNFWMGALVLCGALAGLLVKEDPEARKKAEGKGFIANTLAFVSEKPLRVSAGFYTANNVFLTLTAFQDYQNAGTQFKSQSFKPHYFSTLQLASYLFGNLMLLMSSRDQISKKGFKPEDLAKLEDAAARIIAAQPAEVQKALLADISTHMATMKGVGVDAPTLATHMAERIGRLTTQRLQPTTHASWAERAAAADSMSPAGVSK